MNKRKVALINPPSPFLINERVFPNLGLLNVATSLNRQGYSANVYDFSGVRDAAEQIRQIAGDYNYIGFSSTSPQFIHAYRLFTEAKKSNPKAKFFIGGAHASSVSSFRSKNLENAFSDPNVRKLEEFDIIFEGEGEYVGPEIFREGPKWRKMPLIENIDQTPIPDRSMIDILSYKYLLNGSATTTIMSQRGCPYQCSFCCGRDIEMYRSARAHSPQRILQELDYLNKEFGFSSFMWFDDEVNVNPKRLKEISALIRDREYAHRGFVRSDLILKFPDILKHLKDAGFVELCSGVESGSDAILKRINKRTTYEVNLEAARKIKEMGFSYKAFTIIGNPGETLQDIELTKKWVREAEPDGLDVSLLSPYPGSKIYDGAVPSAKFPEYKWENNGLYFNRPDYSEEDSFFKGIPGEYHCLVRTDELSAQALLKLRDEIEEELKSS
jgi:anaerobic magnesium-protoporphyrin IX monomethyl ester cyclase